MIIGDVMFDHYLIGTVDRISPEAPVPVVRVTEEISRLGGAGNVGRNVVEIGGEPLLIGFRGEDRDGDLLERMLSESGVPYKLFTDPTRPTTRKTRVIAHNQQVVRVDHEDAAPIDGKRLDDLFAFVEKRIIDYRVVVVSDYGKGMVSEEFMERLRGVAEKSGTRVLIDPKTMNFPLYSGADLLTPNLKEASEGAGMPIKDRDGILRAGHALLDRLGLRQLLVTLGADGMAFFRSREEIYHLPTLAKKVYDVTGAGDTVIATIAVCLAAGLDGLSACVMANHAAGIVVGQVGAASVSAAEIENALLGSGEPEIYPWPGAE